MDYQELLNDLFELECKLFMKMDSCQHIIQKCKKKYISADERKQLFLDIHYVFTKLIKTIKNSCPSLTNEDIIFCCLIKSGLKKEVAGYCIGSISRQAVNQRIYRIRKKMVEHSYLCDMIFLSEKRKNVLSI